MKRSVWWPVVALPLVVAPSAGSALAPVLSPLVRPSAGVSWEARVLRATGAGAPDPRAGNALQARAGAERAARADAVRNLLAQARELPVTRATTVGEALADDATRARVEAALRGFEVVSRRYFSDSGVELDVELPLAALATALAPPEAEAPALNTRGRARSTGLVVDARGLRVRPALAPRLLDASGKPLYSAAALGPEARRSAAVAAYLTDAARAQPVVGKRPLVVKAVRAEGSDLVLAPADARRLAATNNAFLAQGRVAILTE